MFDKIYEIEFGNRALRYGALVKNSSFSDDEWDAIFKEIIKEEFPNVFKEIEEGKYGHNAKAIKTIIHTTAGHFILARKYEALLEMLPQDTFSKSGTHPEWIAKEVENNTFRKDLTKDDLCDLMTSACDKEDVSPDLVIFIQELMEYFEITEEYIQEKWKNTEIFKKSYTKEVRREWANLTPKEKLLRAGYPELVVERMESEFLSNVGGHYSYSDEEIKRQLDEYFLEELQACYEAQEED